MWLIQLTKIGSQTGDQKVGVILVQISYLEFISNRRGNQTNTALTIKFLRVLKKQMNDSVEPAAKEHWL